MSNLLLAAIAFVAMKTMLGSGIVRISEFDPFPVVLPPYGAGEGTFRVVCLALSYLLILNILLFTINLIPVPPLDGAGVIEGLFPNSLGRIIRELKRQPIVIVIVMIGLLFSIMRIMSPIYATVKDWL